MTNTHLQHATCLGLLTAVCLWGCAWNMRVSDPPPLDPSDAANAEIRSGAGGPSRTEWPYWPRRMRIHPLTQLATDRETGELVLEVRIEFFDDESHTTKAIGQTLVDLLPGRRPGDEREPMETWVCDLVDPVSNFEHYDAVTRTYLFRLEFDPKIMPAEPVLRAYFHSRDGEHLESMPFELRR